MGSWSFYLSSNNGGFVPTDSDRSSVGEIERNGVGDIEKFWSEIRLDTWSCRPSAEKKNIEEFRCSND